MFDAPARNAESSEERKQMSKVFECFGAWFKDIQNQIGTYNIREPESKKLRKLNIITKEKVKMHFQFNVGIVDNIFDIVHVVNDERGPVSFSSYQRVSW